MYNKERLIELFRERALKFGDFTLASGKKATYYLDGKQVTLHSEGLAQVCAGFLQLISAFDCDAVGGMSIGADPIVGGILTLAAGENRSLDGFLVRKEAKGHGTQKYIEGPVKTDAKVVIVEDVVTTGGSSLKAVERVEEYGCKVVAVLGIVDRMEGGKAAFEERNLSFQTLLTIQDFGIDPPKN